MEDAIKRVSEHIASENERKFVISGVNAHFVNTAERELRFANCLAANDLNVADGISLVIAARICGVKLPARVTGIDLMVELCGLAADAGNTVYLLGGMLGAAQSAATYLEKRFPKLRIVGVDRPPLGRESDPEVVDEIKKRIRLANPDFLFVCFGVPNQEYWIHEHVADLPVRVVMGNGAAFDVLAGFFKRPPVHIQRMGLEWFYRLCTEPRRLWKRYLIGNFQFMETILHQELSGRRIRCIQTFPHRWSA
jgi:N-acetylglucosaminyldiphosphoundecaprenol N-acetyl-beta-D-mannosaminyltransferase